MKIALGIDVAESRKGLDLVAVDSTLRPVWWRRRAVSEDVIAAIDELTPSIVAIDSPPAWAPEGRLRQIERDLRALGIQAFQTPAFEFRAKHHAWMEVGFDVFKLTETKGYPLYRGEGTFEHRSIEVFPHASAVCLRGSVPSRNLPKQIWRREVLRGLGVDESTLTSTDQLDACIAAVTGMSALLGNSCCVGRVGEAVLVLPIAELPASRFPREGEPSERPLATTRFKANREPTQCACGCGALVARRYKPGHDAKHKSKLRAEALGGSEAALEELTRLGWVARTSPGTIE